MPGNFHHADAGLASLILGGLWNFEENSIMKMWALQVGGKCGTFDFDFNMTCRFEGPSSFIESFMSANLQPFVLKLFLGNT